jgi:hypothetical protein
MAENRVTLCQLVRIEQPTMANTLNRMQRNGLVHRGGVHVWRRRPDA